MTSFHRMSVARDWLRAYHAASLSIVDLYADEAALGCRCGGTQILYGRTAITAYWKKRFDEELAGELHDLRQHDGTVVLSYLADDGPVFVKFAFDRDGKITRTQCGPSAQIIPLRRAAAVR